MNRSLLWFLSGCISSLVVLAGCSKGDERIDLTRFISIYPGAPVVELTGDTVPMKVIVRNVSEDKLTALRLEVKSDACHAQVEPDTLPELIPGQRSIFKVQLTRDKSKARQRYPLLLTLYGQGLPVPAGLDLLVDLSPPLEKGWISVGQVTLVSRPHTRTAYYLLAGTPLLFLLGWLLWRWSHQRKKQTPQPKQPSGEKSA